MKKILLLGVVSLLVLNGCGQTPNEGIGSGEEIVKDKGSDFEHIALPPEKPYKSLDSLFKNPAEEILRASDRAAVRYKLRTHASPSKLYHYELKKLMENLSSVTLEDILNITDGFYVSGVRHRELRAELSKLSNENPEQMRRKLTIERDFASARDLAHLCNETILLGLEKRAGKVSDDSWARLASVIVPGEGSEEILRQMIDVPNIESEESLKVALDLAIEKKAEKLAAELAVSHFQNHTSQGREDARALLRRLKGVSLMKVADKINFRIEEEPVNFQKELVAAAEEDDYQVVAELGGQAPFRTLVERAEWVQPQRRQAYLIHIALHYATFEDADLGAFMDDLSELNRERFFTSPFHVSLFIKRLSISLDDLKERLGALSVDARFLLMKEFDAERTARDIAYPAYTDYFFAQLPLDNKLAEFAALAFKNQRFPISNEKLFDLIATSSLSEEDKAAYLNADERSEISVNAIRKVLASLTPSSYERLLQVVTTKNLGPITGDEVEEIANIVKETRPTLAKTWYLVAVPKARKGTLEMSTITAFIGNHWEKRRERADSIYFLNLYGNVPKVEFFLAAANAIGWDRTDSGVEYLYTNASQLDEDSISLDELRKYIGTFMRHALYGEHRRANEVAATCYEALHTSAQTQESIDAIAEMLKTSVGENARFLELVAKIEPR